MSGQSDFGSSQDERLLKVLAEQLKVPLIQISQAAELNHEDSLAMIRSTAAKTIGLIDSFLLAGELEQQHLQLEPVSISAILYEVGQSLQPLASQYDCALELRLDGKCRPIMADRQTLHTALVSLGQSFIESTASERPTIVLAGYKLHEDIMAGLFMAERLNRASHRQARSLYGRARQALPSLQTVAGAGLMIADSLFEVMSTPLVATKHNNLNGLAAAFRPSAQLQLI